MIGAKTRAGGAGEGGEFGVGIEMVDADERGLGRVCEAGAGADGGEGVSEFLGENAGVVVARGVVEIATKNEGEGLVLKNGKGLIKIGDLLGDRGGETVETLADLGDGPVEGAGAEGGGSIDPGGENSAMNEGFLGDGFGFGERPSGKDGGAAIFE